MTMALPEFLQTKTYAAMRLRQTLLDMRLREGIAEYGALKVTQRASGGANLSVDVAAGPAFVQGDLTSRQGLYHVYNDAVVNLAIGTNTSGNPRIDQVVSRVYDSQDGLAGSDEATLEILQGSPQAGATLDNRNGAAVLPLTAMRVADIVVASGASSITNANIRDRRPFARPMIIDVVNAASLDLPVDSVSESHFVLEHQNVETSGFTNLNFQMNGLSSSIYSTNYDEVQLLNTTAQFRYFRGGYNSNTAQLNIVANGPSAGGQRYSGVLRQGLGLVASQRIGDIKAATSSATGSGNHVLSNYHGSTLINSTAVWHTINIWLATGTMTGRFILDRIPLTALSG